MNDSDDLFGGLPAISNAENAPTTTAPELPTTVDLSAQSISGDAEKIAPSEKRKGGTSLVSSLGSAGTAMAFVPHAIRKKKKVTHQTSQSSLYQQTAITPSLVVRANSTGSQSHTEISANNENDQTISVPEKQKAPAEITWKHSSTDNEVTTHECNNDTTAANNNDNDEPPYMENEPESLRLLHASVTHNNMYDPYFPNDYLAYRERKRSEEVRKELQRTALQRLDQQENLRKQIEEKRKKLLESGNYQGLVEEETMTSRRREEDGGGGGGGVGIGMGRGRGRGVTNLPAWLVKKQEEQQHEICTDATGLDGTGKDGQFDDFAR